jgi:prepilin-type N-terminal cleavage/methylation domain-containing protein
MNNSFMRKYLQKCDDLVTTHLLRQAEIGCKACVMTNRFIQSPRTALRPQSNISAFTLIEMLAVIAIIAIMMALIAPAVGNFGSTAGRKGAVNILMNTMEQARVAALESGRDVYVVFVQREFPERDAIAVLRDPDPDSDTTTYEFLTRWIKMPKGVLLYGGKGTSILSATAPLTVFDVDLIPEPVMSGNLKVLKFNSFGGVEFPFKRIERMLIVSEGVRGAGGTEAIVADKKDQIGGFEIITLRRFTGRASLEVSAI